MTSRNMANMVKARVCSTHSSAGFFLLWCFILFQRNAVLCPCIPQTEKSGL